MADPTPRPHTYVALPPLRDDEYTALLHALADVPTTYGDPLGEAMAKLVNATFIGGGA